MAGAGYKLFQTGDVLTAAQVNTYLNEQTVMVFASATARTSALTSVLAEGMVSYLQDTNAVEVYDGSAWVGIGASGDITGVTAGTGLTGGGTSGTVTVSLTTPVSVANGGTGISSFGTGVATWLGTPSSANLASAITDETGTGALVFGTSPTLNDPKINVTFDAETASYTAVLANNGQIVTMDSGSANTFSIPTNASVNFPIGTQLHVIQIGAGQTTIQAVTSGTTTIQSTGATSAAPKLRARYSAASCLKVATDTWYVVGDIA
jgi:hypothetical protein